MAGHTPGLFAVVNGVRYKLSYKQESFLEFLSILSETSNVCDLYNNDELSSECINEILQRGFYYDNERTSLTNITNDVTTKSFNNVPKLKSYWDDYKGTVFISNSKNKSARKILLQTRLKSLFNKL